MKIFKYTIFILCLIGFLLSSFYFKFSHTLIELNPTEYIFDYPVNHVRNIIDTNLCCYKYHDMFFYHGDIGNEVKLHPLSEAENRNRFHLGDLLTASGKSAIYYNWWGKLDLYSAFTIILDSISNNKTRIRIESNVEVNTGWMFDTNHGLPYLTANTVKVHPSTVEEYQIIKAIGDSLGQKNMPPIHEKYRW